ncbi:MAG: hypothetical protein GF384_02815 [Elusimicrobia bacterium]|nr:hypothetical protein [Elusimicrobiota bacterium]MBD3411885.1 hypothetical protein [Elusimicrobiota bacterium]
MTIHNKPDNQNTEIKSAFEIAMEKFKNEPVKEDAINHESLRTEGCRLAASFIQNEKVDIQKKLQKYPADQRAPVDQGIKEIFMLNIILPRNDKTLHEALRALEGLSIILGLNKRVLAVCGQIDQLLKDYQTKQKMYFSQLKEQFTQQASMLQAQVQSQMRAGIQINPENLPEFQKKWKAIIGQIDEQYGAALDHLKKQLVSFS